MKVTTIFLLLFSLICLAKGQIDEEINNILIEMEQSKNNKSDPVPTVPSRDNVNLLDRPLEDNGNPDPKNGDNHDLFLPSKNTDCADQCVPFYQCNNGTVVTDGENLIDMRKNDGPCGNAFLACCKLEHVTKDRYSKHNPDNVQPVGCGFRRRDGVGFKVTGTTSNEAQFGEFPWMVLIDKYEESHEPNPKPLCGGALINNRAVITAAHCVSKKSQRWKVRVGEWDISKIIEPMPHQVIEVESVVIHEKYYPGALFNDIAFLYLKNPVQPADNIDTICLPPQNFKQKARRCYSTGWGKDKFGKRGKYQIIMKKIDLPMVPRKICQENLRRTRLGRFFQLNQSFMCAGGERGKDVCNGDGGGPLVCPLDDDEQSSRYYQAGIVSWGIGCGDENVPGVYVDVAKFRQWIDIQMDVHELDKSSYIVNTDVTDIKF